MKQQHLKILRYNTGTDKKAFVQFKDFFDAAIFNATIVAYSGASVADLISMHSRRYIIDPQTHIFQQELSAYTTENKKTHIPAIKKSVTKYLEKMPAALADKILKLHQKPEPELIAQNLDALVECVYAFQTEFVNTFVVQKEYDKYLKFANMGPRPKLVIAPYFMIKSEDSYSEKQMWLHYNRVCLEKTIALNEQQKEEEIAAQLVLEKDVLSEEFIEMVASTYDFAGYEYIFIWLDDFNAFEAKVKLAVRDFYVEGNSSAIHRIESIASAIGRATSTSGKENEHTKSSRYSPTVSQVEKLSRLLDYCKTMRMSYSYKPILILALLHYGDRDGCISIENAAVYFREYYSNRKAQGLAIEKKQCIYLRDDVTDAQIIANLLSNPVKALIESGFFFYNEDSHVFSVSPDIWSTIDRSNKAAITRICRQKLKDYYKD